MRVGKVMSVAQAKKIVISLSKPGKIPTYCYSISAKKCITGAILRNIKNSTCSQCYALKGFYIAHWVQKILEKRYQAVMYNRQWTNAMVFLILHMKLAFFRWHDAGDLQSVQHLQKIIRVCKMTPKCSHWLPTREWGIVRKYWELNGMIPLNKLIPNLCIRLSATMYDAQPPIKLAEKLGVTVSAVNRTKFNCPASTKTYIEKNGRKLEQEGYCGSCRKCWNNDEFSITYKLH